MPYIKQKDRDKIEDIISVEHTPRDIGLHLDSPGELNYLITSIVHGYLEYKGICYSNINEVIGVLECAKLELYRRIASPYEEDKINENGDVY